jgi:hypothetical protein
VAEEALTNPPEPTQFEDHGMVVVFGELPEEKCLLSKGTMIRMAELLDHQHQKKIHPFDVVFERRLLANKSRQAFVTSLPPFPSFILLLFCCLTTFIMANLS